MYITQALHRSAQQHPDMPATIFADRVRSYGEQIERVSRLAGALRDLGVTEGTRVGILALNSDRYAELLFAVPWADGVVVPANIRWNPAEILYSLDDSGTDLLFVDDAFASMAQELRDGRPRLRIVHMGEAPTPDDLLGYEELVASGAPVADVRRGGDSLAGIFYTGGTTGFPKGVMLSHANMLTSALGCQAAGRIVVPGGRLLHAAPMFHLADLAAWNMQSLVGGTHVVVPAFDPAVLPRVVEEHRVTSLLLVPTMLQMVADHPDVASYDLSSVVTVVYGASPISESLLQRSMKIFPAADFVQAYGMTELSPVATLLSAQDHRDGTLPSGGGTRHRAQRSPHRRRDGHRGPSRRGR